jgi:hypothetical protein
MQSSVFLARNNHHPPVDELARIYQEHNRD